MAHPRLLGARQFKEQLKDRDHQRVPVGQRNRTGGAVRRASRQTEREPSFTVLFKRREPQVMGMFEHRQVFTAIKLHGELGTEVVKSFVALQCGEDLPGQRPSVCLLYTSDAADE